VVIFIQEEQMSLGLFNMLTKASKSITNVLCKNGIVSEEFYDVYLYGFELLLSFIFSTGLVILTGVLINKFFETLFFLFTFIVLRSFTGGFHAMKYWVCTVSTLGVYTLIMTLSVIFDVNNICILVLMLIGLGVLFFKSPVVNPNKEMTDNQIIKNKWISIVLFIALSLVSYFFINIVTGISSTIFFTLVIDLILIFVNTQKRNKLNRS